MPSKATRQVSMKRCRRAASFCVSETSVISSEVAPTREKAEVTRITKTATESIISRRVKAGARRGRLFMAGG